MADPLSSSKEYYKKHFNITYILTVNYPKKISMYKILFLLFNFFYFFFTLLEGIIKIKNAELANRTEELKARSSQAGTCE